MNTPLRHRPGTATARRPAFALAAAAVLDSACAVPPAAPPAAPAPPAAAAAETTPAAGSRAAVQRLLVLTCRAHTDCATVAVGARACGGPEAYLAYAPALTPGPALQQTVAKDQQRRRKELEARGEMSTCELLPDPGAFCTPAGQCALHTPPARGGGSLLR